MGRSLTALWILLHFLPPAASAQESPPPAITVCQVLLEPLQYDGKLISVKGRSVGTNEGEWLVEDNCPGAVVTGDYVWPSAIATLFPAKGSRVQIHQVDFEFDQRSQRSYNKKYEKLKRRARKECIVSVFTGVFETHHDWSKVKKIYSDGTYKYFGFGHLSEAPGQLILKSKDDVETLSGCATRN